MSKDGKVIQDLTLVDCQTTSYLSLLDLVQIVQNFQNSTERPIVRVNHPDQVAGYINRLTVDGKKLIAQLVEIPEKVFDTIQNAKRLGIWLEIARDVEDDANNLWGTVLFSIRLLEITSDAVLKSISVITKEYHVSEEV